MRHIDPRRLEEFEESEQRRKQERAKEREERARQRKREQAKTSQPQQPETEAPIQLSLWARVVEQSLGIINIITFACGLIICTGLLNEGPLRSLAAVALVCFGPGSGLVQLVGRFDTTVKFVVVTGTSVAISVLVAQILLTIGSIGVLQAAIPLTIVTGIGLLLRLWGRRRSDQTEATEDDEK